MLSGLRFLLGAMVACVLTAAFAIALIASSRLNTTSVSLIAPLNGETLRLEREAVAGTGGPFIAPASLRESDTAFPGAAKPASTAPADAPMDAAPEATASIPAQPAPDQTARAPAGGPAEKPPEERQAATDETAAEPTERSGEKQDKSGETKDAPPPKEAKASAERREPARPRATTRFRLPAENNPSPFGIPSTNQEPPFRYFLN